MARKIKKRPGAKSAPSRILILALTFLALVWAVYPAPARAESPAEALVSVDPGRSVGQFRPTLLGHNIEWIDGCDGVMPLEPSGPPLVKFDQDDPADLFSEKALEAIKTLPTPILRFPGGALASSYAWKKGLGPYDKRGLCLNYDDQMEIMYFGTDEYLALLKVLGAKGMIIANPKRSSAEAGDWLKYVMDKGGDAPYWEIGNESFLPQDPSYMPVKFYAARVIKFSEVLKKINPKVKVGALLEASFINTNWGTYVVPELEIWNKSVVSKTAGVVDFYTVHTYVPMDSDSGEKNTLLTMAAGPEAMARNLQEINKLIKRFNPKAELWVTEFNVLTNHWEHNWKYGVTLAQAGCLTSLIMTFVRENVTGASCWSLIGNHNFGLIKDAEETRMRPMALGYRLLAPLAGLEAFQTTIEAETFEYDPAETNVGPGLKPKIIDAQAFVGGGKMHLVVVNRSLDETVKVKVEIPAGYTFTPTSRLTIQGQSVMSSNEDLTLVDMVEDKGETVFNLTPGAICRLWGDLKKD